MNALNDAVSTTGWAEGVVRTAGDGAFLLLEPVDEPNPWRDAICLGVAAFAGAATGKVLVAVPVSVAREVAANLLGRELREEDAFDTAAMAALADMIAGVLLTQWLGADTAWELGMPQGFVETPERFEEMTNAPLWSGHFMTDDRQRLDVVVISAE